MEFRNRDGDLRHPLYSSSSSSFLVYSPPPVRGSAFSKPILPPSSSLLSQKGGGGSGNGSAPVATEDDSSFFGGPKVRGSEPPETVSGLPSCQLSAGGEEEVAGKYRECLRNHAAAVGGHVVDGCGEFMPIAVDGAGASTPDALRCDACGCHRSFHRKDGDDHAHRYHPHRAPPPLLLPPPPLPQRRAFGEAFPASPPPTSRVLRVASATTESSSEERVAGGAPKSKRFRTKFTAEQKEKMMAFAERTGWRFQRQDEALVEQFCSDAGIKRHVLKVWMHNNKHSIKKQQQQQQSPPPPPPPPPPPQHQ